MTKAQQHYAALARIACYLGNTESAARSLSAEIRAAWRDEDKAELLAVARDLKLIDNPHFVI
jgi:hypothetical protein